MWYSGEGKLGQKHTLRLQSTLAIQQEMTRFVLRPSSHRVVPQPRFEALASSVGERRKKPIGTRGNARSPCT